MQPMLLARTDEVIERESPLPLWPRAAWWCAVVVNFFCQARRSLKHDLDERDWLLIPCTYPAKRQPVTLLRHSSVERWKPDEVWTLQAGRVPRDRGLDEGDTCVALAGNQARGITPRPAGLSKALCRLSRHRTRPCSMRASGTAKVGIITSG